MAAESFPTTQAVPRPPRGVRHKLRQARRNWNAYVFLTPALIIFSIFTAFALLFAFYLTFHEVEHRPAAEAVRRAGQLQGHDP
jgi:hypothetical protein